MLIRTLLISLVFIALAGLAFGVIDADYVSFAWAAAGSKATTNGGGALKAAWDAGSPSDFMNTATGAAIVSQNGLTVENQGGEVALTDPGANGWFTSVVDGTIGQLDNYTGDDIVGADIFFAITKHDNDTVILDGTTYVDDGGETADIDIGGVYGGLAAIVNTDLADAGGWFCNVLIKGNETLAGTITVNSGDGIAETRLSFIGVNPPWVNDGTQATLDGDGAVATCLILDGDYMTIENIICTNATAHPLQIGAASYHYHYAVINCKADSTVDHAVEINRMNGTFVNCDFRTTDGGSSAIDGFASAIFLDTCYLETASTTTHCVESERSCSVYNSIFVGGTYGLTASTYQTVNTSFITNCDFYNQVTSCVNIVGNISGVSVYNNLFWVADKANDYAVTIADAGTLLFEDYNFTNIETAHYPMLLNTVELDWQGANSGDNLWSDTETNLWSDAANGIFILVDAAMIDGGMPTLGDEGGTPVDGYTSLGAHGLTQTQAGGGLGPGTTNKSGGKQ